MLDLGFRSFLTRRPVSGDIYGFDIVIGYVSLVMESRDVIIPLLDGMIDIASSNS